MRKPASRASHMAKRRDSAKMTYRDLAKEHGVSKSTAHRIVTGSEESRQRVGQAMRLSKERAF